MLGRHALHDEEHHVASREVDGRRVGGHVERCEEAVELLRGVVLAVGDLRAAARRAEDAEGVAQDEVGLAAVGGVERGVGEGDGTRHAGHAAAHAGDGERRAEGQQQRAARIVAPAVAQQALFARLAAVAPCKQGDEARGDERQVPVLTQELHNQLRRVVVVGEEELLSREALLRVAEVDAVGHVDRHHQQRTHRQVVAVAQVAPPAPLAQTARKGQQREEDEEPLGVDNRGRVELQRPLQELSRLVPRERAQQFVVVEVEDHAAEHQHHIEQHDAPEKQEKRGMEQSFHGRWIWVYGCPGGRRAPLGREAGRAPFRSGPGSASGCKFNGFGGWCNSAAASFVRKIGAASACSGLFDRFR